MSEATEQTFKKLVKCYKCGYEFEVKYLSNLSRKLCFDFLREFIHQFNGYDLKSAIEKAAQKYHITGNTSLNDTYGHKKTDYVLTIIPIEQ